MIGPALFSAHGPSLTPPVGGRTWKYESDDSNLMYVFGTIVCGFPKNICIFAAERMLLE